jgi:hypothetical protein
MSANDIQQLRNWLKTPTRPPTVYLEPQPDTYAAQVEVDFQETDGVKLHFDYHDGCSLCIRLNMDVHSRPINYDNF